ncbi:hypothetical protein GCM10009798_09440 [Nocardioides panacihumi]|uniref:DUF1707 domain-containing protein n=1 Tax=Nocardioides panacihumi TaxID=400774 RepID=A0ABP5BX88_9ACTN
MSGDIRIGDVERERAAATLGDHYAAGRLDHSEYSERLDAIWTARTQADLDMLFHDLPRVAQPEPPARRRGRWPLPVVALLVLVVGGLVITHLPVVLLVLGVVLVVKMSRHRGCASARSWQGRRTAGRW